MSTDARRIAVTMLAGLILGAAFTWAAYALDSDESAGVRLAATVPAAVVFVAVSIGLVRVLDRKPNPVVRRPSKVVVTGQGMQCPECGVPIDTVTVPDEHRMIRLEPCGHEVPLSHYLGRV